MEPIVAVICATLIAVSSAANILSFSAIDPNNHMNEKLTESLESASPLQKLYLVQNPENPKMFLNSHRVGENHRMHKLTKDSISPRLRRHAKPLPHENTISQAMKEGRENEINTRGDLDDEDNFDLEKLHRDALRIRTNLGDRNQRMKGILPFFGTLKSQGLHF